jgi:hypothetical protein
LVPSSVPEHDSAVPSTKNVTIPGTLDQAESITGT